MDCDPDRIGVVALFMVLVLAVVACPAQADGRLDALDILDEQHPRAFFFRQAEGMAAQKNMPYARWERIFERLMGIEGKVLDEEVVGRSAKNIEYFTRFKRRHGDGLVLLHFNGNARDPRWESGRFFAGHWLYYNGVKIAADVPAEGGETDIRVEDARLFRVGMGRYRDKNEDIGLCVLDAEGKPDWSRSEQVQLLSVDVKRKVLRVRRGCYGTKPRAFEAGRSYAAAHMTEGPWGKNNHLLWFYNYATCCPRDAKGQTCADVLVEHLAELFGPAGALAAFDGLEFDVLHHECAGGGRARGADCDGDGRIDRGRRDGLNLYGIGVVEFCRELRRRLGDDRLILADGMGLRNQRAFGILNGIESEGWPHLSDSEIRDWSGGLNRHFFWDQNARPPVFNYINHKYRVPGELPGRPKRAAVPFRTNRLVFAVAALTNAAVCYSDPPAAGPDGMLGVWDELRMGLENRPGWLGKPLGPARRLATGGPRLFELDVAAVTSDVTERFSGAGVQFEAERGALKVEATEGSELRFRLRRVPCDGPDLVVLVTARAAPMRGYPREVARRMYVGLAAEGQQAERPPRFMTWVNQRNFTSAFYFSTMDAKQTDLEFVVEGGEPVWIHRVQAYGCPDVMCREFERGVVLANPGPRPHTFDMARLFPRRRFRRLRGAAEQDARTNDGSVVGNTLRLGPRDGLFLVRDH